MKKYKFTILLLLTFVIAFPVITVKLVTAEQEKKARQEELAQVTDTEKEPPEEQLPERKKTAQIKPVQDRQILIVQKIQKIKQVSRIMKRWQIRSRREPLQQRISAIFSDALFIGDSRTVGLSEYADLGDADVFATIGLSSFKLFETEVDMPRAMEKKL